MTTPARTTLAHGVLRSQRQREIEEVFVGVRDVPTAFADNHAGKLATPKDVDEGSPRMLVGSRRLVTSSAPRRRPSLLAGGNRAGFAQSARRGGRGQ